MPKQKHNPSFSMGYKGSIWRQLAFLIKDKFYLILPAVAAYITVRYSTNILLEDLVLNRAGDNMYHLMNQFALKYGAESGDNLFGPVAIDFGQPLFRFYQPLFYLVNLAIHFWTDIDIRIIHNHLIVYCFALSPFSFCYFLRKLGFDKWTAGLGAFMSMLSVAAFGNSFEAYHQAGIVTQSMGGLFFPWFMGNFIGMLKGENRASSTALLFSFAFLSHAILAVFAVFAGALYYFVTPLAIKTTWKKLTAFALIGTCLVSFWVLPFLEHTHTLRPVPDSIIRRGVIWFTSISTDDLPEALISGRLLDDPAVLHKDQTDRLDKIIDRINIMGTLHVRPPVITILTGVGLLIAFLGMRRARYRFLLAGFVFSLMLFAGPDDYPWLRALPFMKQIQTFRCTYLLEFFAFGLVGAALGTFLRFIWAVAASRSKLMTVVFLPAWLATVSAIVYYGALENMAIGKTHLTIRDPKTYNQMIDAISTLDNQGYPFRLAPHCNVRPKRHQAWLAVNGYHPYCTHWKGTGPTAAFHLCKAMSNAVRYRNLNGLVGARYHSLVSSKAGPFLNASDSGEPLYIRLPNGKDRKNVDNIKSHYLMDSGYTNFLRLPQNEPLPVVCSDEQWVWMTRAWTLRYRDFLHLKNTPFPFRVTAGELKQSPELLKRSKAIIYLDHRKIDDDKATLEQFTSDDKTMISSLDVDGLKLKLIDSDHSMWKLLPPELQRSDDTGPEKGAREKLPDMARVKMLGDGRHSRQFFAFDVDIFEPTIATLPMMNVPGWKATLDGKPTPIYSAGPAMNTVLLPAGAHRLIFHWEMPTMHRILLWLSVATLAFTVLMWLLGFTRRLLGYRR